VKVLVIIITSIVIHEIDNILGTLFWTVQGILQESERSLDCCQISASCLLTALSVCVNFWLQNKMTAIPHPLYSPDMVLCDFFSFPKLRMGLKFSSYYGYSSKISGCTCQISSSACQIALTVV